MARASSSSPKNRASSDQEVRIEIGSTKHKGHTIFWRRTLHKEGIVTAYGPELLHQISNDKKITPEQEEAAAKLSSVTLLYRREEVNLEDGLVSKVGWNFGEDGWRVQHGEAARRRLQGRWQDRLTQALWFSVQHIKMHSDEFYEFEAKLSDGKRICDVMLRAIQNGNTSELELLMKVICEVNASANRPESRNWRVANAVRRAAKRHGRVPTCSEALIAYSEIMNRGVLIGEDPSEYPPRLDACGKIINEIPPDYVDYSERTFRDAIVDAGLGWMLARR